MFFLNAFFFLFIVYLFWLSGWGKQQFHQDWFVHLNKFFTLLVLLSLETYIIFVLKLLNGKKQNKKK